MQLLEVKNDIAKIVYNPTENHLLPSDFLLIEDVNQKLIAQIINIAATENSNNNFADVRLALSIDKDDNLSYYNGYIPSKASSVIYINPDEIIELLKGNDENIYFGNLSNHSGCFAKIDLSFINDRVYIRSDRDDKTKTIIQNIISELYSKQKKVILLDFDGRFNSIVNVPKLKISESFKLPLNIDAFNNILEYDTVDCPLEDKAVIQSIVLELREYIKTVENKFLPFTLFKNVIDNEFMANPVSGLMLLRNKLWLYAQDSIFAESKSQFDIINAVLDKQNLLVIDASCLEEKWYKFAIQTILSLVNKHCYFALSLNDVPMDKKSIINLYNKPSVIPIVSTTYDSNYAKILKSVCKNQILFKPANCQKDGESFDVLLNKINSGEFILFGESTLYLPLILELQAFDSSTSEEVIQNEIKKDVDKLFSSSKKVLPSETEDIGNVEKSNIPNDVEANNTPENKADVKPVDDLNINDGLIDNDFNDSDLDFLDNQNREQITIDDLRNMKKTEESKKAEKYDVFTPLSEIDEIYLSSDEDDIVSESLKDRNIDADKTDNIIPDDILPMGVTPPEKSVQAIPDVPAEPEMLNQEQLNDEILPESEPAGNLGLESNDENLQLLETLDSIGIENDEDKENSDYKNTVIDDVINDITSKEAEKERLSEFSEKELQENSDENNTEDNKPENTQDTAKEDSFDIELEADDNTDEIPLPPIKEDIHSKNSPDLTVYETDNSSEISIENIPFKIGDKVYHPKHGNGVIEGFANYSNKILFCQIEFENVGRRILDPRVAGIEKIS